MALCSAYGIGLSQLDIVGDQCEFPVVLYCDLYCNGLHV